MKLKNSNRDETQFFMKLKTQMMMKLKNSNCDETQNGYKTQKLKM